MKLDGMQWFRLFHLCIVCELQIDNESLSERAFKVTSEERREEWAIKVDIDHPVTDFHDRIPDMAYKVSQGHVTLSKQSFHYHSICRLH